MGFLRKEYKSAKSYWLTSKRSSLLLYLQCVILRVYMVIVLRHKLGNTYEHPFVDIYFFYVPLHRVICCMRLRCICWYPVLSAGNFYVTRVGWINCFIVIYCVFLFYMLMVLRCTGSRFKYFLYVLFMLIYFAGTAPRVIWSEYTYTYIVHARVVLLLLYAYLYHYAQHLPQCSRFPENQIWGGQW